jgi:hypothetical protein
MLSTVGLQPSSAATKVTTPITKAKVKPKVVVKRPASFMGFNEAVHRSTFGLVVDVVSVSAPRYNSSDGKRYERTKGEWPIQFRLVTVKVVESLFGKPTTNQFDVVFYGTGDNTGEVVHILDATTTIRENSMTGPVASGDQLVVLLLGGELQGKNFRLKSHFPTEAYRSVWLTKGDRSESLDPLRSVQTSVLKARIQEERSAGRNPKRDAGTHRSPFASVVSPQATTTLPVLPPPSLPAPPEDLVIKTEAVGKGDQWSASFIERTSGFLLQGTVENDPWPNFGVSVVRTNGTMQGPDNDVIIVCRKTKGGSRILIGMSRGPGGIKSTDGLIWSRRPHPSAFFFLATPNSDQTTTVLDDGRTFTRQCSIDGFGPQLLLPTTPKG